MWITLDTFITVLQSRRIPRFLTAFNSDIFRILCLSTIYSQNVNKRMFGKMSIMYFLTTKCGKRKFFISKCCTNRCLFTVKQLKSLKNKGKTGNQILDGKLTISYNMRAVLWKWRQFFILWRRHTPEKKDKEVFNDGKNDFSAEEAPAREGSRISCQNELGRREKGSRSKKS